MKILILSWIFLYLPVIIAGNRQKWQDVASPQLKLIFRGKFFNLTAFYYSKDIKNVHKLCETYSGKVKKTKKYNKTLAAKECKLFFNHRVLVQKWIDQVFLDMTKYGLSKYNSAKLKSYIWWLDSQTYNDFITTLRCFMEHYQNPFPNKLWKKMNSSWNQAMNKMNSSPLADKVISYSLERLARFALYGIFNNIVPPCNL